ncbi:hypothetical protein LUZ62_025620 [Rhynchospora pubera]|uniref:DUF4220 domain-containing protein n=1 Tax=Rhynchospora pubera TaxID=906938 RepID=A0AAV8H8Q8_9POAL|nr:hypothetical protein LUZ62_070961 [Rhynchospora pubera]KAJ4813054.1 hypothetical protein LUZ62_025620 [Rhynchospora pubera]
MQIISEKWRNLWSSNEVRVLILASLALQIGLIFLAPLRKRSANKFLALTLWIFYLTADYVATLAIGNVLSKQNEVTVQCGASGTDPCELTALWAPFLLLHLGGPDTITSYSIEDNELWWRHLLGLVVQVASAAFVFLQSPPNQGLWIATILMFIPGLIKFIERTLALRSGSKDNLKDKIISELGPRNDFKVDFVSTSSNISEGEKELILEGYGWFGIFKRLLVDVTFSPNLLMQSQNRFSEVRTREALNLVAIELSFFYDILHTKAVQIHCIIGRVVRCSSLVSIIAALVTFTYLDKHTYASADIIITYILFGAGLSLEVIAAVILLFSDWMVVSLGRSGYGKCFAGAITMTMKGVLRNGKPRWSRTIGQYNLIGLCLRDRYTVITWIMRKLKIKGKWDNMRETKSIPLPEMLGDMMFNEAKRRAQNVHIYNVLVEARTYRGSKTLERHGKLKLLEWSMKKEFDECIILWHIATDICYHIDPSNISNQNESELIVGWNVSNYMIYLLTQQPSMLQLGYGKTRFEATCTVAKKILKAEGKLEEKAARDVLEAKTRGPGGNSVEDDKEAGVSVLVDGCKLARELLDLHQKIRWSLISEAWMEMLGYAAIHCDSYQHARALSRGGELLTHLWLLMAQLGVVEEHKMQQFQSASV